MEPAAPFDSVLTQLATHAEGEVVVRLAVPWQNQRPNQRPGKGTIYKDITTEAEKPDVHVWGDYKLLEIEDGPQGWHYYFFGRPRTEVEKWTPVDEWEDMEVETWPPVLKGLRLVEDRGAPVSVSKPSTTDPRARVYVYPQIPFASIIPQTTALCQVKWERFQSDTPFEGLSYPRPVAGDVSWNFGVMGSGSFTALHPDIRIKRPPGRYQVVEDPTPGFVDAPFRKDLFFPATRFKTWRPYVFAVKPSKVNHLYVLDRGTIYPPPRPKPVRS